VGPLRSSRADPVKGLAVKSPTSITCASCAHRKSGIFAGVGEAALSRIERQRTVQTFHPGQEIFCAGGPLLAVYCLHEGRVKLSMAGDGGEELVLEFCEPGRLLGLRAAMAEGSYEATAVSMERSVVCTIPREVFYDTLDHSPSMARAAAAVLAGEVSRAHARLMEAVQHNVTQRAAHVLLMLHERAAAAPDKAPRALSMRRGDLAHMIGTTPETLSRVLHRLEARGAVSVTRAEIRVANVTLLRRIGKLALDVH
jgi:CRP/FNR family transcriptional regulator, polysaccharide utilization system transcription regulator